MSEENKVTKFDHEVFGALDIILTGGSELFIAKQVCSILGHSNPSQAVKDNVDDEDKSLITNKDKFSLDLKIPPRGLLAVNESGVYDLILGSRKREAKEFKRWITKTVLPTLRKESMYVVDEEKVSSGEMSEDELILKAMTLMQTKVDRYKHEKEVAVAESERLQGVCATITDQFINEGQTAPKFCRKLNGVNINQVQNYLCDKKMLLPKSKNGWSPTSYARDRYLTERTSEHFGITLSTAILTKEGAQWLYKKYLKGELPMKQTWDGEFTNEVFEG